jgi:hypothetical protein
MGQRNTQVESNLAGGPENLAPCFLSLSSMRRRHFHLSPLHKNTEGAPGSVFVPGSWVGLFFHSYRGRRSRPAQLFLSPLPPGILFPHVAYNQENPPSRLLVRARPSELRRHAPPPPLRRQLTSRPHFLFGGLWPLCTRRSNGYRNVFHTKSSQYHKILLIN